LALPLALDVLKAAIMVCVRWNLPATSNSPAQLPN
jgi:hypothetical protein